MKRIVVFALVLCGALMMSGLASAQSNPMVKLSVTLPDGKVQDLSVRESGTGTLTLADGTEIGIRPTILDAKPWTHILLTFFKMPTSTHGVEELGSVEVKTGGSAVSSKTTPVLKVAVPSVTESHPATS